MRLEIIIHSVIYKTRHMAAQSHNAVQ